MKLRTTFSLLLILFATSPDVSSLANTLECSFNVKIEQLNSTPGRKGQFKLLPSGGKAPYKFVVYKSSGHLISEDFNKSVFDELSPDTYHAIVVDEKGCKYQLEIQLK